MTHDEMRIAVAEAMGWKFYCVNSFGNRVYHGPHGEVASIEDYPCSMPDYPADLNACHEMEPKAPRYAYYKELCKVVCGGPAEDVDDWAQIVSATAPQRCEAFLRVRGKWVDGNNT